MSNATSDIAWVESLFRTPNDQFMDTLSMLYIIDVGIIKNIDANGRATITTTRVVGGNIVQLKDVEVIGLGNNNGAFMVDGNNCACLLFAPRSCMPDVRATDIDFSSGLYGKGGIKALPISNGMNTTVRATFTSEGYLNIVTDDYMFCFEEGRVACTGLSGFVISLDNAGEIYLHRKTDQSGELTFKIDDTGIITSFANSQNTSVYSFEINDNGVLTITHTQPQQQGDPKVLNSIVIKDDGTLEITSGNSVSFSTTGDLSLSAGGNITIDSGSNKSVSINGTNLKVDK